MQYNDFSDTGCIKFNTTVDYFLIILIGGLLYFFGSDFSKDIHFLHISSGIRL